MVARNPIRFKLIDTGPVLFVELGVVSLSLLVLLFGLTLGIGALYRSGLLTRTWRISNQRLLLGLPIGTLVVVGVNVGFFALAQRGLEHPSDPLILPFVSWGYDYPYGVVTSAVAHANVWHLAGNLTAVLLFAPIAEYVVGHRNSRRPYLRAFVAIPLLWYVLGLVPAAFSWGPGLGYSGAVFAFFGFVVVFYPVRTVILLVLAAVVGTVVRSLVDPVQVTVEGEVFTRPGWANIAVEAHMLGVLLGFGVALLFARRYDYPVHRFRVGAALVVVAIVHGLWQFSTSTGTVFVLYRALGVGTVLVLGVALSYTATSLSSGRVLDPSGVSLRRLAATSFLLLPLAVLVSVGVLVLLALGSFALVDAPAGVEVGDYEVFYADSVEGAFESPFDEVAGERVVLSGVVVTSEARGVSTTAVSPRELGSDTTRTVRVGDLGWIQEVEVERTGMSTVTSESTYTVRLSDDADREVVHDSGPADTGASFDGWDVYLETRDSEHAAVVDDGETRVYVELDESPRSSMGFEFVVRDGDVHVERDGSSALIGRLG